MSVLLVSSDLMFAPQASSAAKSLGGSCRMVSPGDLAEALTPEIRLVPVDLAMVSADPAAIVGVVKEKAPGASVVAFGPHVHEARLQGARDAGCQQVLSRGEMHAKLRGVLGEYLAAKG